MWRSKTEFRATRGRWSTIVLSSLLVLALMTIAITEIDQLRNGYNAEQPAKALDGREFSVTDAVLERVHFDDRSNNLSFKVKGCERIFVYEHDYSNSFIWLLQPGDRVDFTYIQSSQQHTSVTRFASPVLATRGDGSFSNPVDSNGKPIEPVLIGK